MKGLPTRNLERSIENKKISVRDSWMIKIKIADPSEIETLLDAAGYKEVIGA